MKKPKPRKFLDDYPMTSLYVAVVVTVVLILEVLILVVRS
jgi:hypothetical protein